MIYQIRWINSFPTDYSSHERVNDLSLWVWVESTEDIKQYTDENRAFTLTGLPPSLIRVRTSHLDFEIPITAIITVELGLFKYPLVHLPLPTWWTVTPLPALSILLQQSQTVDIEILTHRT
jgi:hypothetical protein